MSQSDSGKKDEKRWKIRCVYDSFMFRFVAIHIWIGRKLSLNVRMVSGRGGQLFGKDGVRRFVDAIFDAILDREGTPSVLGHLNLDTTAVSVEEYLRLGHGPALAAAALSRVEDAQQNARLIVKKVMRVKDAEERRRCLTACLHFAKLRKDGNRYPEYMDAALERMFGRMPKPEAASERKFLARTWKKVGFAWGKRIGLDESKRIGLVSERKSAVRKLRQKVHAPKRDESSKISIEIKMEAVGMNPLLSLAPCIASGTHSKNYNS